MTAPTAPAARFDDFTTGTAWEPRGLVGEIRADRPTEVPAALAAAQRAADAGSWVAGFVAYDAAPGVDRDLAVPGCGRDGGPPLAWFGVFRERTDVALVDRPRLPLPRLDLHPDAGAADHAAAVAEIRRRIEAGDVYQVNLTHRFTGRFGGAPVELYRAMAWGQRSAYGAYVDTGRHAVVSSSPELFFSLTDRTVRMRPMKGTAPRGRWPEEDEARAAALAASPKDRAENVMIVDLVRNDLARLGGRGGSVAVEALCALERYPTVWQLTSTVRNDVPAPVGLPEIFASTFPPGSVTGAPKIAAMSVIAALERSARGVYCGAVGWLAPPPARERARFNVAIRTAVVDRDAGTITYGAGGGITWDSEPSTEHEELMAKTLVLTAPTVPTGLLETLRFEPGGPWRLLPLHLDRLEGSAAYLGIPFDRAAAEAAVREAVAARTEAARVRVNLGVDGALAVDVTGAPPRGGPVVLAVDPVPVDAGDWRWYHKLADRSRYDARRRRRPDVDDVLLVNGDGHVTETTTASVAVRVGGRWRTPPIEDGCLPGVGRRDALARGVVVEGRVTLDDVLGGAPLATVSGLRGWRPARVVP